MYEQPRHDVHDGGRIEHRLDYQCLLWVRLNVTRSARLTQEAEGVAVTEKQRVLNISLQ
jgi:hypothetical protein